MSLIGVYVDDIVLAGQSLKRFEEVKKALSQRFDVKDLGELTVYAKTYNLMAKWKCVPTYNCARARMYYASIRNNIVYVCVTISVSRPTRDRMDFSRFRRLVSQSASSGSVPRYCYTLPSW